MRELILKWSLKNAVDHSGVAMVGPVISKVVAEKPDLKDRIKEVRAESEVIVRQVNQLSLQDQRKKLGEIAPELLVKRRIEERKELPPLPNAEQGGVVTRLPPEPSGHMHVGHAMSGLLNFLYARMYDGKLWLRFEDTNPRMVRKEYYEIFRGGYKWLGIEWDEEKNNSDDLETYYRLAESLIANGFAYTCGCPVDVMRAHRKQRAECVHRDKSTEINLDEWRRMLQGDFEEGTVVLRLKGDMSSDNTVMRDPTLFRIVGVPHPLTGDKYRVWPTYDFAVSVEDSVCGVTHVLRSSEFALRDELQNFIRALLDLKHPVIIEYSRFNFKGTPLSKRKLRSLVEEKLVSGWDDPRLPTIHGVRRRGIVPEAIREFTVGQTGFTFAPREYDWVLIMSVNRKILDPVTKRYYFVPDPLGVTVGGAPKAVARLRNHPDRDLGEREIPTSGEFYLPRADVDKLDTGALIRLKGLYNIRIKEVGPERAVAEYAGEELTGGVPIVQWVAEENQEAVVAVPDVLFVDGRFNEKSIVLVNGLAEVSCGEIEEGQIVQLERFGFCRLDEKGEKLSFIFAHR